MFDNKFRKIEVNVKDRTKAVLVWDVMKEALLKEKDATELDGVAPPGDLAKQLQQFLETVQPRQQGRQ